MDIRSMELRQTADRKAKCVLTLNVPPSELSKIADEINRGKPYTVTIKPKREAKSDEQRKTVWAKIGEIADALGASKDEIYEECLRRYGQGTWLRLVKEDIQDVARYYRLVDVKKDHGDGSVTVLVYKGLSEMNSQEASVLLDGVLSECKEIGLSGEVE